MHAHGNINKNEKKITSSSKKHSDSEARLPSTKSFLTIDPLFSDTAVSTHLYCRTSAGGNRIAWSQCPWVLLGLRQSSAIIQPILFSDARDVLLRILSLCDGASSALPFVAICLDDCTSPATDQATTNASERILRMCSQSSTRNSSRQLRTHTNTNTRTSTRNTMTQWIVHDARTQRRHQPTIKAARLQTREETQR